MVGSIEIRNLIAIKVLDQHEVTWPHVDLANAAGSVIGGRVGEYRKPRVTVSAVEAVDVLCACINELSEKLSISSHLFVLVSDDDVAAKFHKTVSTTLSEAVRKWVCLVSRRHQMPSANGIQDTSDRWLKTDLVRHFETWMDRRSARRVHDHLDAGQCIIFVQVSNNDEESDVYRIVERFCVGSVQQHDLPV